jgi:NAD(P)-dependent dehydrogenase (short-subunit alcohol dehydrogenase family)
VNVVSPGPVATPIYGKLGMEKEQLDSVAESIRSQILVGRFGEPVEIAKAIVFLASDESSYTVGSELIIDGGMSNL